MKQMIGVLMATILLLVSVLPVVVTAAPMPLRVEVNGERVNFPDEEPYADKAQRVQVPVRFVSEALGAKVNWASATKTVTITRDTDTLVLVLGQSSYEVNGEMKLMDTKASRTGGRVFVPLRFVSEGLGASVKWDSVVRTVYISTAGFVEDFEKPKEETVETGEVREEVIHGFKVKHNTGSKLDIEKGTGVGGEGLIHLMIRFWNFGKADYDMQVKEVEEILSQKVKEETVKEIIKYIRTKTTEEPELKLKIFKDENYEVYVNSNINSNISVLVAKRQ